MSRPGNRGVRGIRQPGPGGTLIGRRAGTGAVEFLTFQDLANYVVHQSGLVNPAFPSSSLVQPQLVHADGFAVLLSGVTTVVCSFNLPEGTWDISGSITFDPNGAAASMFNQAIVAISQSPVVLPSPPNGGGYAAHSGVLSTSTTTTLTTAVMRFTALSLSTPIYLLAQATFA